MTFTRKFVKGRVLARADFGEKVEPANKSALKYVARYH